MNRIALVATAAPGTEVDLLQVNPDGTQKSFSVTAGHPFIEAYPKFSLKKYSPTAAR